MSMLDSKVLAEVGPHVLWIVFLFGLLFFVGRQGLRDLLSRARKIAFPGFSVELAEEIEKAAELRGVRMTGHLKTRIAESLRRLSPLAAGARILWIDPNPKNNVIEIRILSRLGAVIDLARSDEDARACLSGAVYDVVLSNMTRDDNESAGEEFIHDIRTVVVPPPVILYVGKQRPLPARAFAITTRPDELFHLILRALEHGEA